MSRAVELAKKCGFPDWWLNPPEPERQNGDAKRMVEGLYHAARAEALREAADWLAKKDWEYSDELRAMADREGK